MMCIVLCFCLWVDVQVTMHLACFDMVLLTVDSKLELIPSSLPMLIIQATLLIRLDLVECVHVW